MRWIALTRVTFSFFGSADLGIKKQLQLLQQRQADYRKSEQKMYSAMFKS